MPRIIYSFNVRRISMAFALQKSSRVQLCFTCFQIFYGLDYIMFVEYIHGLLQTMTTVLRALIDYCSYGIDSFRTISYDEVTLLFFRLLNKSCYHCIISAPFQKGVFVYIQPSSLRSKPIIKLNYIEFPELIETSLI